MFAHLNSGLVVPVVLLVCCVALLLISIGLFAGHVASQATVYAIGELVPRGETEEAAYRLPPQILEHIKPFLAPGTSIPTDPNELRSFYARASDLLAERER